jgi:hypothetical protein
MLLFSASWLKIISPVNLFLISNFILFFQKKTVIGSQSLKREKYKTHTMATNNG